MTWKKGPKTLRDGDKYSLRQDGAVCELQIHGLTTADAGEYSCVCGQEKTSAKLTVRGKDGWLVFMLLLSFLPAFMCGTASVVPCGHVPIYSSRSSCCCLSPITCFLPHLYMGSVTHTVALDQCVAWLWWLLRHTHVWGTGEDLGHTEC